LKRSNLSNLIILILVITISILISIGYYYKHTLKKNLYEDIFIVNQLGQIRGNIQRYAKLKIASNKKYLTVNKKIDSIFNKLSNKFAKTEILPKTNKEKFIKNFYSLKNYWEKIKTLSNTQLIKTTENAWQKSNFLIQQYENLHTLKFTQALKNINLFLFIAIIFLTLLIGIIYIKIKKGLEIYSIQDGLTGLYNRFHFNQVYNFLINNLYSPEKTFSMMIIDIDNFKKINDTYGHDKGDEILKKIGDIIIKTIRKTDFAFRYGGEEFVIIFPHTKLEKGFNIAERIRKSISKNIIINSKPVTISGGIGEYKGEKPIDFFRKIDEALYKAKNNGKNKIVIAN